MARRTYNRTRLDLSMDYYEKKALQDSYFNVNEFKGINVNKNYLGIDQQTFADANNVYVDQDEQLSTRPPVKEHKITAQNKTVYLIPDNERILSVKKINTIVFYHTTDGENYFLRWVYNDVDFVLSVEEKIFICWVEKWYVLFTQSGNSNPSVQAFAYNYTPNDDTTTNFARWYTLYGADDVIYTPSFVGTDITIDDKDKNILSTGYKISYPLEYGQSIPTQQLIGKTIQLIVGDELPFTLTWKDNTDKIITTPFAAPQLNVNWAEIQVATSDAGEVYFVETDRPRYSADGQMFTAIPEPDDGPSTNKRRTYRLCRTVQDLNGQPGTMLYCVTKTYPSGNVPTMTVWYVMIGYGSFPQSSAAWKSISCPLPTQNRTDYAENGRWYAKINEMSFNIVGTDNYVHWLHTSWDNCVRACDSPEPGEFVMLCPAQGEITYKAYFGNNNPNAGPINNGLRNENTNYGTYKYTLNSAYIFVVIHNGIAQSYAMLNAPLADVEDGPEQMLLRYSIADYSIITVLGQYSRTSLSYFYIALDANKMPLYNYRQFANISSSRVTKYGTFAESIQCFERSYTFYKTNSTNTQRNRTFTCSINYDSVTTTDAFALAMGASDTETGVSKIIAAVAYTHPTWKPTLGGGGSKPTTPSADYRGKDSGLLTRRSDAPANAYVNNFEYTQTTVSSIYIRNVYPLSFTRLTGADLVLDEIADDNTRNASSWQISENGTALSDRYLYYADERIDLLQRGGDNTSVFVNDAGRINYYNSQTKFLYTNEWSGKVYANVSQPGVTQLFMPDDYIIGYRNAFSKNNKVYLLVKETETKGQLYIKQGGVVEFEGDVTAMTNFSQTSIGVFLENRVYTLDNTQNGVELNLTKLQLGNRKGSTVLESYDGASIFVTNLKGLTALTYQDFVQSSEQVYNYLTEAIVDLYDLYTVSPIRLMQYKNWIFMYRKDVNYFYLFDLRSNSWWKWTVPFNVEDMIYDGELLLFMNGSMYSFDSCAAEFKDYGDNVINWHFVTQRLHFGAPNNYKHLRAVNIVTSQDTNEIRYKLTFYNYRNLNNTESDDVLEFTIENLLMAIERIGFIKTDAFQIKVENDVTDENPKKFVTPLVGIKYRVTERIR